MESVLRLGLLLKGGREEDALLPAVDLSVEKGWLNVRDGRRMRSILERESPAMRQDREFGGLESTLPVSARALMMRDEPVEPDHAFVVLPEDYDPAKRYPILLFLHGATMNFQLYAWGFWKRPEHNRWIITLPTNDGWGTSSADWDEFYLELIDYVMEHYSGDERLVCVAGHSAGAQAAMRFAALHPEIVRCAASLAGTSPWLKAEEQPLNALLGKAVLVHCAGADQIVPLSVCEQFHERLLASGVHHEYVVSPEMDHFSILEAGSGPHADLMVWLEEIRTVRAGGIGPRDDLRE